MTQPIQHVIWDWNGTLLNDAWLCVEILNQMMTRRAMPTLSLDQYQAWFGFPVEAFYRQLGFDFDREAFEDVATEFISHYERRRLEASLHENSIAALERVRQSGMRQSILSAYSRATLESIVEHWRLREYFTHCAGLGDHFASGKVELGQALVGQLTCSREEVVLIGDTTHDAEVAQACGIPCCLVEGGHQSRVRLTATGCPVFSTVTHCLDSLPGLD